ncbi:P-type conjugative transfer protein VirB9 [Stenotrophomonas maltophilia]|uniref:P-type conjugative transfer protein VirB9 n=1 Tax=Stenotrophomonas maltophilia TaxID=40324 RepID=UPI00313BBCAF
MKRLLLSFALMTAAGVVSALDVPLGSTYDGRVKQIAYNEHDVVAVYSYPGIATQIVFADGEEVLDKASGFSAGWEFQDRRNMLFVKPKSVAAAGGDGEEATVIPPQPGEWDTNLIVTTNKRTYIFQLFLVAGRNGSKKLEYDPRMAFRIQFTYPSDIAALHVASSSRAETEALLAVSPKAKNLNYTMKQARRSSGIAPTAAYDDGRFTYLEFSANGELPTVFLVDERGEESLVNTHMSAGTLVVHRVAPKLMLRLGRQAVAVFNESYDSSTGSAPSGSTVPGVQRTVSTPANNDMPVQAPLAAGAGIARDAVMAAEAWAKSEASRRTAGLVAQANPQLQVGTVEVLPARGAATDQVLPPVPPSTASDAAPTGQTVVPAPSFVGVANARVVDTLRSWAPEGWQVKWDTDADARAPAMSSSGDFLDAVKALTGTRRQWTAAGRDFSTAPLQVLVYKADRIIQVRDPSISTAPAAAAANTSSGVDR